MLTLLAEPFSYQFMMDALTIAAVTGGLCGLLSAFLVLKGWSLIGDALSHAILPGVAVSALLGLPLVFGAFFSGGLAAAGMLFIETRTDLKRDVVIGVVFSAFFALGLFILSVRPVGINLEAVAVGNILAIAPAVWWQIMIIAGLSVSVVALLRRDLSLLFFDEAQARALGLPVTAQRILFFAILSAATVAAFLAVGAFLVIALLVIPAATVHLFTDRFDRLLGGSALFGALTGFLGAYASYFAQTVTGATIVMLQAALFALAALLAPRYGLLARRRLSTAGSAR